MSIEDSLQQDFKRALKEGNTIIKNTVQMIRSDILLAEKNRITGLTKYEIEEVFLKHKKQRVEALIQYEAGNRRDLMEQTEKEIAYINSYLPQQLSEYDIKQEVLKVVSSSNYTMKQLGDVIRMMKEKLGHSADGKLLAAVVKDVIANNTRV